MSNGFACRSCRYVVTTNSRRLCGGSGWRQDEPFDSARAATKPDHDEYIGHIRRVEDLGYTILLTPDHFQEQLAPFTALTAAAEASRTLRIGSCVFANDFRHPVVLAAEAATVDVLAEGRFEFGIGTGYMAPDYAMTGLPLDPPGVRVGRLAESVQIIKGLFGDEPVTYSGRYYSVAGLNGYPKPHQRPRPPLLIAGGGQRVLTLAAREADIVGLMMQSRNGGIDFTSGSTTATAERVAWVRHAAGDPLCELGVQHPALWCCHHQPSAAGGRGSGPAPRLDRLTLSTSSVGPPKNRRALPLRSRRADPGGA
jgi:probable F420-dependent oxidoreductase